MGEVPLHQPSPAEADVVVVLIAMAIADLSRGRLWQSDSSQRTHSVALQGCLAHKKTPTPLGPP